MSITTKKGDRGTTSLYGGAKVYKDDPRIEACGSIDELSAFLGFVKSQMRQKMITKMLESLLEDLMVIGAELTMKETVAGKLKKRITKKDVLGLEDMIVALDARIPLAKGRFYISGENMVSSSLDIARTVARRAERKVTTMLRKKMLRNRDILVYLNRLSDLLYLLTRAYERAHTPFVTAGLHAKS